MSNLMDPDGTNRIIKQQIKEWQAVVDGQRIARLLESDQSGSQLPLKGLLALARAWVVGRLFSGQPRQPKGPNAAAPAKAAEPRPE
jgi:hypothetical protein